MQTFRLRAAGGRVAASPCTPGALLTGVASLSRNAGASARAAAAIPAGRRRKPRACGVA
jgi:hypothetical protein